MRSDEYEKCGALWTRRELLRTAGSVLAAGLLAPRIAKAATFSLVSHATGYYGTTPVLDSTGADLLVAVFAGFTAELAPGSYGANTLDSKGNAWTLAIAANESTSPSYLAIWYCAHPATVGAGHTFSFGRGTANYPGCEFAAFSGSATTPLDSQSSSNSSAGVSVQPGSITPSTNDELVISGVSCRIDASAPTVSGMTLLDAMSDNVGYSWAGGLAYQIQTSAAAVNPTWTADAGVVSATVAFKSTSSVGGAAPVRRRWIGGN